MRLFLLLIFLFIFSYGCKTLKVLDDPIFRKDSVPLRSVVFKTHISSDINSVLDSFNISNVNPNNIESCTCADSTYYFINKIEGELNSGLYASRGGSNGEGNFGGLLFRGEINHIDNKKNNLFSLFSSKSPNPFAFNYAGNSSFPTISDTIYIAILDAPVSNSFSSSIMLDSRGKYTVENNSFNLNYQDHTNHGEMVVAALIQELEDLGNNNFIKISVYDVVDFHKRYPAVYSFRVICAITDLMKNQQFNYINMSFGFYDEIRFVEMLLKEYISINPDIKITCSAGNDRKTLYPLHSSKKTIHYPSQYSENFDNLFQVIGTQEDNQFWNKSRFLKRRGTNIEAGSTNSINALAVIDEDNNGGTSFSAPRYLAKLIMASNNR